MNECLSVLIVDDHVLIAEIWGELINTNPKFQVIGICSNTDSAIELVKEKRPNIVIMDVNLQPISGIDATKIIKKISPGTKVIGVSLHNQPSFAKRMIKNGASGYVTKNSGKQEVFEAIEAASAGKVYICKEIQENISKQFIMQDELPDISKLSEREIEIINKIKDGLSAKEIAEQLFISSRTVETHRANILKKLNQKNTSSLLKFIHNSSLGD